MTTKVRITKNLNLATATYSISKNPSASGEALSLGKNEGDYVALTKNPNGSPAYFTKSPGTSVVLAYGNPLACNDAVSDPVFTSPATDDYTLGGGSPCIGGGIDGVDQGIFWSGLEVLGA